ncbi:hypothetical protein EV383_6254 [Pseudonocardia sediminis]|uniref:Uncharacterized protein n=1 Tax=Pseudonocardia sediminis TaxID=1397368 RepID=A0A4Q7UA88_PSEST|nr:hypothetical protein EV383_6254 [Pseudonocardia sediminis]
MSRWGGVAVGEARAAALVRELAGLAGRGVDDVEATAIVAQARTMSSQRSNTVWTQLRRAPATVSMRDYLAMTLRFVAQDPTWTD